MQTNHLDRTQTIPAPIEDVFPFFQQPANLERLTPPMLGMHILTPEPAPMHPGAIIDYIVKIRGLPMRWTTCISEYDPPHRFVDVQLRGPYSFWHHTHEFRSVDEGTEVIDRVRYLVPFGPLGQIAHALMIRRDIESIFDYRRKVLEDIFPPKKA